MNLNDLLKSSGIDPKNVLVLRHRPTEAPLNRVLPWLATERPRLFNAYQQTQKLKVEHTMKTMIGTGYVASFIRHSAKRALFVGLYSIGESRSLTPNEFWQLPESEELKRFGMRDFFVEDSRTSVLWFDLTLEDFYADWKGKLVVGWPPPERSWYRRAHTNVFPVISILEDSALDPEPPEWDQMEFTWDDLQILPTRMKHKLSEWRGIYYIFDSFDQKGYVGSAYGVKNLLGRWLNYAKRGDGGNKFLRQREPRNFRFTILQLVAPTTTTNEVIQLESSWKRRLHTRHPNGLNDN